MNIIEYLISYTIDNYCDEEYEVFYESLKSIKNFNDEDYIEKELIAKLVKIISIAKNCLIKRTIIEIITTYLCCQLYNSEELVYKNIEDLFRCYLESITESIDVKEVSVCLNNFIELGIDKRKVIKEVIERLDRTDIISLFATMIENDDFDILKELNELGDDIKIAKKINYRSRVILTLILITHPLCSKYSYIKCISPNYSDLLSAVCDWGWNTPGSTKYLVSRGIFSEEEGSILEQLGKMLFERVDLNSEEIEDIYNKFLKGRDPYDVMFTLP